MNAVALTVLIVAMTFAVLGLAAVFGITSWVAAAVLTAKVASAEQICDRELWHHSHLYHESHKGIPKGLKRVPGETQIRRFEQGKGSTFSFTLPLSSVQLNSSAP